MYNITKKDLLKIDKDMYDGPIRDFFLKKGIDYDLFIKDNWEFLKGYQETIDYTKYDDADDYELTDADFTDFTKNLTEDCNKELTEDEYNRYIYNYFKRIYCDINEIDEVHVEEYLDDGYERRFNKEPQLFIDHRIKLRNMKIVDLLSEG